MTTALFDCPDYSKYSIAELQDVLACIDREQYPERFERANSALTVKLNHQKAQAVEDENESGTADSPASLAELKLISIICLLGGILPIPALFFGQFYDIAPHNNWWEKIEAIYWFTVLAFTVAWFVSLVVDSKFAQQLGGKVAPVSIPLLFGLMGFFVFSELIPLGLHLLSDTRATEGMGHYRKESSIRLCRYRIVFSKSKHFKSIELCLESSQYKQLPA